MKERLGSWLRRLLTGVSVVLLLQTESELVAKDDNQDAAENKKENQKNEDQEEQMDQEEKEKIHEQGDEVRT